MKICRTHVSLLLAALALQGCIQTAPIPGYARVGDEVVIGLGGIHHNARSNYFLKSSDIGATLTDSAGHVFNLGATSTFKAFPDYVSKMTYSTVTQAANTNAVPNFDGGWFASLRIKDADNTGVPIALGPATIAISSPSLKQTNVTGEGKYASQKIEIIAGTSAQGTFAQQFSYYGPAATSLAIAPTTMTPLAATTVGGLILQIDYTDESKIGLNALILPLAHHPYLQVIQSIKSNGNGTGSIMAVVLNPHGFVATANRTQKQSSLEDLSVGMEWFGNQTAANIKAIASINIEKSYYIDLSGNMIAGVKPGFL